MQYDPEQLHSQMVSEELSAVEVVLFARALMTDEAITQERSELQARLLAAQALGDGLSYERSKRMRDRLETTQLQPYPRVVLDADDQRSKELVRQIQGSPALERGTWYGYRLRADDLRQIVISAASEPVEVPMSNIVSIDSFDSWQGRGLNGTGEKMSNHDGVRRTSAETIALYAAMDTELPAVDSVTAFIQPNGLVFYEVGCGAHRAAAAFQRGDESIKAKELRVYAIQDNVFELPDPVTEGVEK